jgi:hypothetical protein
MGDDAMGSQTGNYSGPPPDSKHEVLEELRGIRAELAALREVLDAALGAALNTFLPYGKPVDRWRRPRG